LRILRIRFYKFALSPVIRDVFAKHLSFPSRENLTREIFLFLSKNFQVYIVPRVCGRAGGAFAGFSLQPAEAIEDRRIDVRSNKDTDHGQKTSSQMFVVRQLMPTLATRGFRLPRASRRSGPR
jgi:hypothetical protein